ncbi:MAG: PEP/pyruvate-binding domain-containing protein, partial [Candidatus Omnitrophica bacterium]|nr:PEP/pyruvate-binding domain-containing protein [Candidatus Omnitrophota bacterium]
MAHPAFELFVAKEVAIGDHDKFWDKVLQLTREGKLQAAGAAFSDKDQERLDEKISYIRNKTGKAEKDFPVIVNIPDYHGQDYPAKEIDESESITQGPRFQNRKTGESYWALERYTPDLDIYFDDGKYLAGSYLDKAERKIQEKDFSGAVKYLDIAFRTDRYNVDTVIELYRRIMEGLRNADKRPSTVVFPYEAEEDLQHVQGPLEDGGNKSDDSVKGSGNLSKEKLVLDIRDSSCEEINLVGGKAASLNELARISTISVPNGFSVTTNAFNNYIDHLGIRGQVEEIEGILKGLWHSGTEEMIRAKSDFIKRRILVGDLDSGLKEIIGHVYRKFGEEVKVAVRSSATAEDMPQASFAGQYTSLLNVKGEEAIIEAIKKVWASTYNFNALNYIKQNNIELRKVRMGVLILEMVDAESSGIAFSVDTETGYPFVSISSSYGLGELIVSGNVNSDSWVVDAGNRTIIKKRLGSKETKIIYDNNKRINVRKATSLKERNEFTIDVNKAKEIAVKVQIIADYYGKNYGANYVDTEFSVDRDGKVLFVQCRPETVFSKGHIEIRATKNDTPNRILLQGGVTGSLGIVSGRIRIFSSYQEADKGIKPGDILVTKNTTNDWEYALGKADGAVTDIGDSGCHTAIVTREQRKPSIVGMENATEVLKFYDGQMVTIDGIRRIIYLGKVEDAYVASFSWDRYEPSYKGLFKKTIEESWIEARQTGQTHGDSYSGGWIGKPNKPVSREFTRIIYQKSHRKIANMLRSPIRDKFDNNIYQVRFEDIFKWMDAVNRMGLTEMEELYSSRIENIERFLRESRNLALNRDSISGWIESFILLNAYMGFVFNVKEIIQGRLDQKITDLRVPGPYFLLYRQAMTPFYGETLAMEKIRKEEELYKKLRNDDKLVKILETAVENNDFEVLKMEYHTYYHSLIKYIVNFKVIKNTDEIFDAVFPLRDIAQSFLKNYKKTVGIVNSQPTHEVFYPEDRDFQRIFRLAVLFENLRQDAHHIKVRGQWAFVETLKPLAEYLMQKGEIKNFKDMFNKSDAGKDNIEWLLMKAEEYGKQHSLGKSLPRVEIEDYEAIRIKKYTTMGRWEFTTFSISEDELILHNAIRIEELPYKTEFLIDGNNLPRDIRLKIRVLTESEKRKVSDIIANLGIENEILVMILDNASAFNRIYGVNTAGEIFIREDIIRSGDSVAIKEAFHHLMLKSTGLPYVVLKGIQYYGNLRDLITKLSHRTIKAKLLYRQKEIASFEEFEVMEESVKGTISALVEKELAAKKDEYKQEWEVFRNDGDFYDQVTREMVRNNAGFIKALDVVRKISADKHAGKNDIDIQGGIIRERLPREIHGLITHRNILQSISYPEWKVEIFLKIREAKVNEANEDIIYRVERTTIDSAVADIKNFPNHAKNYILEIVSADYEWIYVDIRELLDCVRCQCVLEIGKNDRLLVFDSGECLGDFIENNPGSEILCIFARREEGAIHYCYVVKYVPLDAFSGEKNNGDGGKESLLLDFHKGKVLEKLRVIWAEFSPLKMRYESLYQRLLSDDAAYDTFIADIIRKGGKQFIIQFNPNKKSFQVKPAEIPIILSVEPPIVNKDGLFTKSYKDNVKGTSLEPLYATVQIAESAVTPMHSPAPFSSGHLILCPNMSENKTQKLDSGAVKVALMLINDSVYDEHLKIGFNGWGGWASQNQLHLQTFFYETPDSHLPIALPVESFKAKEISRVQGITISELLDYPVLGFVFLGNDIAALTTKVIAAVRIMQDTVVRILPNTKGINHNLLFTKNSDGSLAVYLFPRKYEERNVDNGVGVAFLELSGELIMSDKKYFDNLKERDDLAIDQEVMRELEKVSLDERQFEELKQKVVNDNYLDGGVDLGKGINLGDLNFEPAAAQNILYALKVLEDSNRFIEEVQLALKILDANNLPRQFNIRIEGNAGLFGRIDADTISLVFDSAVIARAPPQFTAFLMLLNAYQLFPPSLNEDIRKIFREYVYSSNPETSIIEKARSYLKNEQESQSVYWYTKLDELDRIISLRTDGILSDQETFEKLYNYLTYLKVIAFDPLQGAAYKAFMNGMIRAWYVPVWADRPAAVVELDNQATQDIERIGVRSDDHDNSRCEFCKSVRIGAEQLVSIVSLEAPNRSWRLRANQFPIFNNHFLLLPLAKDSSLAPLAQRLTADHIEDLLDISSRYPVFRLFFNSYGAGGIQPHFHCQGLPGRKLIIEDYEKDKIRQIDNVEVYRLRNYPAVALCFEGPDRQ